MNIFITKVLQATKDNIKVLRFGKSDVRQAIQYLPHGVDSKPLKNTKALFATTSNKGETAVLGYFLKSDATEPGESKYYAVNDAGEEIFSPLYFCRDQIISFPASLVVSSTGLFHRSHQRFST